MSMKIMDIDGDEFAECDYGLVVDNSNGTQDLNSKLDMLAQAALQNQTLSFSSIIKLYNSGSISEKTRMIEKDEEKIQQQQSQAQQQQLEAEQAANQAQLDMKIQELQAKDQINIRDNETKLIIAQMGSQQIDDGIQEVDPIKKEELLEKIRQFDNKLLLEKEKLVLDKQKHQDDVMLRNKQINKQAVRSASK